MNKKQLILATAALVTTTAALADISMYGTAHVDLRLNEPASNATLNSNNSILGFKFTTDLSGLKAYFKHNVVVSGIDSEDDQFLNGTDTSYLSLQGRLGTLRLGLRDTPATQAVGSVGNNHLPDSIVDFSQVGFTEYNKTRSLAYETHPYAGFSMVFGGISIEDADRSLFDSLSLGLMYNEGNGLKLGLGYEKLDSHDIISIVNTLEKNGVNPDLTNQDSKISLLQLAASYTFDNLTIGAQLEQIENALGSAGNTSKYGLIPQEGVDRTIAGVSIKNVSGKNTFSLSMGTEKIERGNNEATHHFTGIAYSRAFTQHFNAYIAFRNKYGNATKLTNAISTNLVDVSSLAKERNLAIGMMYQF